MTGAAASRLLSQPHSGAACLGTLNDKRACRRAGPGVRGLWCNVTKDPYLSCTRPGIVTASGVLAAMAEEVALVSRDPETRCLSGSAECRRLGAEPAECHGGGEGVADDLRFACGLG